MLFEQQVVVHAKNVKLHVNENSLSNQFFVLSGNLTFFLLDLGSAPSCG